MRIVAGWLVLALAACTHQRLSSGSAAEAFTVLPPAAWGCEFQVQQRLSSVRDQQQRQLTALVEVRRSGLQMVGLTGLGLKLFVLRQDADGQVEWNSLMPLPEGFDPIFVLRDFQLAYLPHAELSSALQPGWTLQAGPGEGRSLLHEGRRAVEISRNEADAWGGIMRLSNLDRAYTLTAQTLSVSAYGGDTPCPRPLR